MNLNTSMLWNKAQVPKEVYKDNFLSFEDPKANIKKLAAVINPIDIAPQIMTKHVFESTPKRNYVHLGYDNPVEYQTRLGDDALLGGTMIMLLSVITLTFFNTISCVSYSSEGDIDVAVDLCYDRAGQWWQSSEAKGLIFSAGLLIMGAVKLHHSGWLGSWFHDTSRGKRVAELTRLYQGIAKEFNEQAKEAIKNKDSEKYLANRKIAKQIHDNLETIELYLQSEAQISEGQSKNVLEHLKVVVNKYFSVEKI